MSCPCRGWRLWHSRAAHAGAAWRAGGLRAAAANPAAHVHHGRAGDGEKAPGTVSKLAVRDIQCSPCQLSCPGEPRPHLNFSTSTSGASSSALRVMRGSSPQPVRCLLLEAPWEQIILRAAGGPLASTPLCGGAVNGRAPGGPGDGTHLGSCGSSSLALCRATDLCHTWSSGKVERDEDPVWGVAPSPCPITRVADAGNHLWCPQQLRHMSWAGPAAGGGHATSKDAPLSTAPCWLLTSWGQPAGHFPWRSSFSGLSPALEWY